MPKIDITGQTFGKLTALKEEGRNKSGNITWNCVCTCGNATVVVGSDLRKLRTQSCGCHRKEAATTHGFRHTQEYNSWRAMKERCYNPKSKSFENYGGRGIGMCSEWRESFQNFYNDMGAKPSSAHSIDRKDINGDYNPDNCKWSTRTEQSRNRRVQCNNETGERGVGINHGKYRVRIGINGEMVDVGRFDTIEESINARNDAEKSMW